MRLTVAICTHNRSDRLRRTLASLAALHVPPALSWEILVVNNGCKDATDKVIAASRARLPIRRIFEPQIGISRARNSAVRFADGEYIIWTDDDVLVNPNWLAAYSRAFTRWPDAAVFGGAIVPVYEGRPPDWLTQVSERVAAAYAARSVGSSPCRLRLPSDVPFGANYAVRAKEQRAHLYDVRLGRRPGSEMVAEETTCVRAILRAGGTGWWVPGTTVQHMIPTERQSLSYLWRYYAGQGEFNARTEAPGDGQAWVLGRPRWVWRQWLIAALRFCALRPVASADAWIDDLITASYSWGLVRGYRRPFVDLTGADRVQAVDGVGRPICPPVVNESSKARAA